MEYVEKHFRKLPKESFDNINKSRKICKLTWGEVFERLDSKKELLLNRILGINPHATHCQEQSVATITRLLPLWCENISGNMEYINKYGPATKIICDTHPNCWKLEKLHEQIKSPDIFSVEEAAEVTKIPKELIECSQQIVLMKGVNYAGTVACSDCEHYTLAKKPAIIIANGPSLVTHNNLELINKYGFNGDIFCVTAALKKVLEAGIVPKYIGSLDAEDKDTDFIDYPIVDKAVEENPDKMIGLFGTTVHPTTNKRYKGNRVFYTGHVAELDAPNISHTVHLLTKAPAMNTCGNIGSSLWSLAIFLGYNPLILIGFDLSWETFDDMLKYHPKSKKEDWFDENGKPRYKRWYNKEYKKQYFTEPVFESYKISTLEWIRVLGKNGVITINCTEQGALHGKGIINMKFEDYLKNPSCDIILK